MSDSKGFFKALKAGDRVEMIRTPYGQTEPVIHRGVIDHAREDGWMLRLDNGDFLRANHDEVSAVRD